MGSSNTENNNNSDFYSYLQKNDLAYMNYINQTPKGVPNMQRIAQLIRSIKTIINIKSNFRSYEVSIFHKQIIKTFIIIKCLTKSKWSWWWKQAFQTTAYRDWINQAVNKIHYWNWKKKHIKHILGMGSSNTENYNNNDFYSYLQKNDLIYTH